MQRCHWVSQDPIYIDYHDNEWGKPQFDSHKLFEQLCLEGQQAGLSWITILKKRQNYRNAFYHFIPEKIVQMSAKDVDLLMQNQGIIRHRAKLEAIIKNAQAYLKMQENGEDFSQFIWSFVNHQPQINSIVDREDIPNKSPTSIALSKSLKQRGFVFVGETTCYAFMQAVGLVNDHYNKCECKSNIK